MLPPETVRTGFEGVQAARTHPSMSRREKRFIGNLLLVLADPLVIDDAVLYPAEYSLQHRLERFIYVGDDRQIAHRFCRGQEITEPKMI